MTSTPTIFTRNQVRIICDPVLLKKTHKAMLAKGDVTIGELVALNDAIQFSSEWFSGNPHKFFTFEETAKHCEAVLAIHAKHFPVTA